jgi:hypothetical protein
MAGVNPYRGQTVGECDNIPYVDKDNWYDRILGKTELGISSSVMLSIDLLTSWQHSENHFVLLGLTSSIREVY